MKILSYKKRFCAILERTAGGAIDRKRIDPDIDQPAEVAKNATQKMQRKKMRVKIPEVSLSFAHRQRPHTRVFFSKN